MKKISKRGNKGGVVFILMSVILLTGCGFHIEWLSFGELLEGEHFTVNLSDSEEQATSEPAADPRESREIITVGKADSKVPNLFLHLSVNEFNDIQDEYWVEIKAYERFENLQGADIFCLTGAPWQSWAEKGVLEDLTPYFEGSTGIMRENVVDSVWRAGSVGGQMLYVIPRFTSLKYADDAGNTRYRMYFDQIFGMNAGSENKEGAWLFFSYMLSEREQLAVRDGYFPVRKDALERLLETDEYRKGIWEKLEGSIVITIKRAE